MYEGENTLSGEVAEGVQRVHGGSCGNCYGKSVRLGDYRVHVLGVSIHIGKACGTGISGPSLMSVRKVPFVIT